MENKWLITTIVVLVALILVSGLAFTGAHSWAKKKMGGFGNKFMPFDKGINYQDTESLKQELGLPEGATHEEVQEALKKQMEEKMKEQSASVKSKLGLPDDASQEDVNNALSSWAEENKDLIMLSQKGIRNFGWR